MTNSKTNLVATVLIPIAGNLEYFDETIDSILVQTNENFQVLMVNDGISDRANEWLSKKVSNLNNFQIIKSSGTGISAALNTGIGTIQTDYIIRMDSDDLMYLDRIQSQIDFMENNHEVDIAGTQIQLFNSEGLLNISMFPISNLKITQELEYQNCIAHPTVIMRRSSIIGLDLYDSFYDGMEDYELWRRLRSLGLTFANFESAKLAYRIHNKQYSQEKLIHTKRLFILMKLEEILGKKNRHLFPESIEDYLSFLMNKVRVTSPKQYEKVVKSVLIHDIIEGGFSALRSKLANKVFFLVKLVYKSPRLFFFAMKLIAKKVLLRAIHIIRFYLKEKINYIRYKKFNYIRHKFRLMIYRNVKAMAFSENIVLKKLFLIFYTIIKSLIFNHRIRPLIPEGILSRVVKVINKFNNCWKWCESNNLGYLAYFDGIDWIFLWGKEGLVWHIFTDRPMEICHADDDLFTQGYLPSAGDIIFDVGAGVGTSALLFSQAIGPRGKVYSFEPDPDSYRRLVKMIKLLGLKNITPLQLGIVDVVGKITLYRDSMAGVTNSIFRNDLPEHCEINVTTLDNFVEENAIKKIDLLKMNIEGAETLAIAGIANSKGIISNLVIGCHDFMPGSNFATKKDSMNLLQAYGYQIAEHKFVEREPWASYYIYAKK
jgi:FkbM family methyltransferase